MAVRGLKTRIAFNVALLLLISALVTDIVVVLVLQSAWVRKSIEKEKATYHRLATYLLSSSSPLAAEQALDDKQGVLNILVEGMEPRPLLMVNSAGHIRFHAYDSSLDEASLRNAAYAVLRTGREKQSYMHYKWTTFWWQPSKVLASFPVGGDRQISGAVAVLISLDPVYRTINQYNKPIFFYIILNSGILTLVGLYRIFRIYLRPIDRIVAQADLYQEDDDLLFAFRREDNELNRLSTALNQMLQRISTDKKKMRDNVVSLEKAYSELRHAQNEVIRAEKMAGVGRLAAGLAHEIGNPIGIVIGYLDLLKDESLTRAERADFVSRAYQETQRMHAIISQLLNLARTKDTKSGELSVHAVVEDVATMMRHQPIMQKFELDLAMDAPRDMVRADGEQLRQVLVNLLINAADAVDAVSGKRGGHIRISTSNGKEDVSGDHDKLYLQVEDNGEGIPDREIDNIFDPFYTTKEPGKGTGLGLAVSYTIIEKMGGTIAVESELGKGTSIEIALPMLHQRPEPCRDTAASNQGDEKADKG